MRLLVPLLALAWTSNAWAGGIGVLATSGIHTQQTYYYDESDDLEQYKLTQVIPSYGTGLEIVLGDHEERVIGLFRAYWLQDMPERHPRDISNDVDSDDVVADVRDVPRNVGMGSIGIQWGFLGDPNGFMVTAVGAMGSGFLTTDHTEFFQMELGGGFAYNFAKMPVQGYANAAYAVRYRKNWSHGPVVYAGLRYMFD